MMSDIKEIRYKGIGNRGNKCKDILYELANKLFNHYTFIPLYLVLVFYVWSPSGFAQSTRSLVNDGVDLYKEKKFSDAEVSFKKGTENTPDNFESRFNLGDAYFKQQRFDESIKSFESALTYARDDNERAKIHYNIGNSFLKSQKMDQAISSYKQSLKLNPNDEEVKYNLSYALSQKNNQDKQKDKNKDQKDKDQNKDKNQSKDQEQQKNQQQDKQKDQQSQQQNKEQQQENQQQKPMQEQKISKEEAERILNALKNDEKNLQKQLRKVKGRKVKTEKDW